VQRTLIINEPDNINWRRIHGKLQLLCPKCGEWFELGGDFDVDDEGNVSDVAYHPCANDYGDDEDGWVVLAQLDGWNTI
jgi:hypothetical protein